MVPVTYLTMDEIARGVGASQVLPYVEGLARRGMQISPVARTPGTPVTVLGEGCTAEATLTVSSTIK